MSLSRLALLLFLCAWLAVPQDQPSDTPLMRITVNLVQVEAIVTDKDGRQVTDLNPSDFQILQDGKSQKITHCTYIPLAAGPAVTSKPRPNQIRRTTAFVVDDLSLSFQSMTDAKNALKKFVNEQMQEGDLAAIVRTAGSNGFLQQFTTDKRKLIAAADALRWHWQSSSGGGTAFAANGGTGAETIRRLIDLANGLRSLPGRRSIVLFSEGDLLGPGAEDQGAYRPEAFPTFEKLLDMTSRAASPIYVIDGRGLPTLSMSASRRIQSPQAESNEPNQPSTTFDQVLQADRASTMQQYRDSQESLQFVASKTGGLFYRDKASDLSIPLRMAMDHQKGYYLLGYTPDRSTFDDAKGVRKFHKIAIKVKRPGLSVHTQAGFLNKQDEPPSPKGTTKAMVAALLSPFGSPDIATGMTALYFDGPEGPFVTSLVNVKAGDLTFKEAGDTREAEGEISVMLFGENGELADQTAVTFTAKLREPDYELALKNGFLYSLKLPLKHPGPYDVRVAVRDKATGKVGTASSFLEAPDLKTGALALSGILLQTPLPSGQAAEPGKDLRGGTALRIFHPGETLTYGYQVLNATLARGASKPNIEAQVTLFRDGKEFWADKPAPVPVDTDVKRVPAGGDLKIGTRMPPGEYVLQTTVTDMAADPKSRTATQRIDFRIEQ
jgi:VWFA-related protein